MIKRIIGYLAVLILTIYLFFMYNDTVISGLLIFVIMYPLLSFWFLMIQRGKVGTDMTRIPSMGEEGKTIKAGITVKNQSAWNMRYEAVILVGNKIEEKKKQKRIRGVIQAENVRTFWYELPGNICGSMEITLNEIRIYDPLCIFYIRRREAETVFVKIMPEFELMPVEITRKTREFRREDSLKDIHWKLTAAKEELVAKERAFPLGCAVLIWFDIREKECTANGFSKMLKTASSLSITLVEEKCIHLAAWYEEDTEQIVTVKVKDEESCCQMVWELIDIKPCGNTEKRDSYMRERFKGAEFSSIVTIDGQGQIKKDGKEELFLRL